jgi:hypothetical protein
MPVHIVDPLVDPRWSDLLERHPAASVFHSPGWLSALQRTYGFSPRVVTTTPPGDALRNGLALCEVRGWTGPRLVSLPFSDHCEPIIDTPQESSEILTYLSTGIDGGRRTSVELRPRTSAIVPSASVGWTPSQKYVLHRCDLAPAIGDIYKRLHPSCIQRPIRRAEREQLECETGSSFALLDIFYDLLRKTRRRHGLPPQPIAWFRNLAAALRDALTVRVASKAGRPIAAILTIKFKKRLVYKYGGSDAAYHNLGAMPFLFWKTIEEAKRDGLDELDLGRSSLSQPGLIAFKNRLGAARSTLTYYRVPEPRDEAHRGPWWQPGAQWLIRHLPNRALSVASRVLYRHLA